MFIFSNLLNLIYADLLSSLKLNSINFLCELFSNFFTVDYLPVDILQFCSVKFYHTQVKDLFFISRFSFFIMKDADDLPKWQVLNYIPGALVFPLLSILLLMAHSTPVLWRNVVSRSLTWKTTAP